jgi:hypothetical protein
MQLHGARLQDVTGHLAYKPIRFRPTTLVYVLHATLVKDFAVKPLASVPPGPVCHQTKVKCGHFRSARMEQHLNVLYPSRVKAFCMLDSMNFDTVLVSTHLSCNHNRIDLQA